MPIRNFIQIINNLRESIVTIIILLGYTWWLLIRKVGGGGGILVREIYGKVRVNRDFEKSFLYNDDF